MLQRRENKVCARGGKDDDLLLRRRRHTDVGLSEAASTGNTHALTLARTIRTHTNTPSTDGQTDQRNGKVHQHTRKTRARTRKWTTTELMTPKHEPQKQMESAAARSFDRRYARACARQCFHRRCARARARRESCSCDRGRRRRFRYPNTVVPADRVATLLSAARRRRRRRWTGRAERLRGNNIVIVTLS